MKQFLKDNVITHNLMSFTGFKSVLIFSALLESPKSYDDLKEIIKNHPYLNETISVDTLRNYFNSMCEMGCEIRKIKQDGVMKFYIEKHPFSLNFTKAQIKAIIKVYRAISKSVEVEDLLHLQKFFNKISDYVENEDLKLKLRNISPLNNIDENMLKELMGYANNNTEIVVLYNSGYSGRKNVTILADKLHIINNKLYLSGFNSEHNTYSSFPVAKIIKIVGVNIENKILKAPEIIVGYEYSETSDDKLDLLENEKLIKSENGKVFVEITSRNKFEITQRILSLSSKCRVLYPDDFKNHIVSILKKMKEAYIEK